MQKCKKKLTLRKTNVILQCHQNTTGNNLKKISKNWWEGNRREGGGRGGVGGREGWRGREKCEV